ncbi:hypothetical protein DDB_G0270240 [Dictyostelium discoideum AX4]|uniref:Uncharacterized protein n=1 Tax=Dictyostelium discoideum TaxID=44689 RepID=Q55C39_DICDI|nr:hypothetical protein DDB_G0270240 [Dictyostelium discoideum AX4]EAL72470.1 hypothetical protein DDB_G0270240 [Dictyostelium discoideum AX4]|eukprot:XP_646642.1 hypothetical protein DDB_G0270240 [Dictyostelium discoideum AX4]
MSIFKSITSLSVSKSVSKSSIGQSGNFGGAQTSNQITGNGVVAGSKKSASGVYYHHEESKSSTTFVSGSSSENEFVGAWGH